jgi:hypothetical protein
MFRIRPAQSETLERHAVADFERRLCSHVREHFPARAASLAADDLTAQLRTVLARAAEHGFTSERHLCLYATLAMAFGPAFDAEPWAADILAATGLDAAAHIDRLVEEALRAPTAPEAEQGATP